MSARPVRSIITVIMNLLVIAAVLLVIAVIVEFFGALSSQPWGEAVVKVADVITVPFGVGLIKTGYGGAFDVDAALTVLLLLLVEWALSSVRVRS